MLVLDCGVTLEDNWTASGNLSSILFVLHHSLSSPGNNRNNAKDPRRR